MGPNERLERSQWDFFWVPEGAEMVDREELAAVRSPRPMPHLNMVTRTRAAPARLDGLVAEMGAWFGHGIARWLVPDTFDCAPLETALRRAGWAPVNRYEARAIRPSAHARRPDDRFDVRRVETRSALRHCIDVTSAAFGHPLPFTDAELDAELAQCADPSGRVHRYVVYRDGVPVSSGGFNWYPALGFAFLWAGATIPSARGAGAYSALVAARLRDAAAMGAEWAGLYAKDDTSAPIVARQGFERVGEMRYWAPASSS